MITVPMRSLAKSVFLRAVGHTAKREAEIAGSCVLMYHAVQKRVTQSPLDEYAICAKEFENHLRYLKRNRHVVPVRQIQEALSNDEKLDHSWVSITLDDALYCQVTTAAEILSEANLPWSLCVPAGLIDTERTVWSYELSFLLLECWHNSTIPAPLALGDELALTTLKERQHALREIRRRINQLKVDPVRYVEKLIEANGRENFQCQLAEDGRFALASWDNLKGIAASGVEILSHGFEHRPNNADLQGEMRNREIVGSKQFLEEKLASNVYGFAFPHGAWDSSASNLLRDANYAYGLTSDGKRVRDSSNVFAIPRFVSEFKLDQLRRNLLTESV